MITVQSLDRRISTVRDNLSAAFRGLKKSVDKSVETMKEQLHVRMVEAYMAYDEHDDRIATLEKVTVEQLRSQIECLDSKVGQFQDDQAIVDNTIDHRIDKLASVVRNIEQDVPVQDKEPEPEPYVRLTIETREGTVVNAPADHLLEAASAVGNPRFTHGIFQDDDYVACVTLTREWR